MWVRYRHKFGHGPGEWVWADLGDCSAMSEIDLAELVQRVMEERRDRLRL